MRAAPLAAVLIMGCATLSWVDDGRTAIDAAARVGNDVDAAFAPRYTTAAALANEQAGADESLYAALMHAWDTAAIALGAYRAALLTAESALDTIDAAGRGRFYAAAACLVSALVRLADAMIAVGVVLPDAASEIIDAARPAEWLCAHE